MAPDDATCQMHTKDLETGLTKENGLRQTCSDNGFCFPAL